MKIGSIQSFKANFSENDKDFIKLAKQQALDSRRYADFQNATRAIKLNFPRGEIRKLKSLPDVDTFEFTPKAPIQFTFRKDPIEKYDNYTSALDAYVKLASMIRKIAQ